ncbi:hypothetical protein NEOLEDRAFT_1169519 [Neolentinus lepideus HHB14362 ss-1]|uniref:DUF7770 domain-containing protein n=1 Tax=Neolentinus lepideus HHB14362 ss-1 TaxID=1314782 RepID=A0A165SLM6_9AGAM|nr:hypothetical protein NEOLEDRAFT_1169519 [Neolentinus lepideus HHB14362 ss-1]
MHNILGEVVQVAAGQQARRAANPENRDTVFIQIQDSSKHSEKNKRDRYRLQEPGSGCCFWCETVLTDFESAGWLETGSASGASGWLDTVAADVGTVMCPRGQGTFY